ncbi:acetylcholine receptor subunit beta-type acr-3-like [Ruditapes philippinarum]|uniref:acetylcholine receptor subunit beta-type acr-3-like n=1 Tax=Ruditapes philippinarum TaxID=129788 RepID=UPI00295AEFFE|nr:acetylcholine receptor subunit beta-type acr-3-like [Ruditapes philippinarum]
MGTRNDFVEPFLKGTTIDKSSDRFRVNEWGEMEWMPAGLIESTCSVNAKKCPFDSQSCDTSFTSLGYKSNEVNLQAGFPNVMLNVYSPHALWDITASEVKTVILGSGNEAEITFTIHLERNATFAVINIIMPILILSLLNVLVFLLVPESGERIGYCITTLLVIAVYMTIVNDLLPQTSQPVPLISYKLMIDLLISALIVFVTIIDMRLYCKDDNNSVPNWLKSIYRFLTCTGRKTHPDDTEEMKQRREIKFKGTDSTVMQENASNSKTKDCSGELKNKQERKDDPITWKQISYMVDWIALFTCIFLTVMNMILFLGMAAS